MSRWRAFKLARWVAAAAATAVFGYYLWRDRPDDRAAPGLSPAIDGYKGRGDK